MHGITKETISQDDLAEKTSSSADCIWFDLSTASAHRYNFHHTTTVPARDFTWLWVWKRSTDYYG